MSSGRSSNNFIDWLLKLGVLLFVGSVFYELGLDIDFENDFWFLTVRIILIILFVGITGLVFVLSRSNFNFIGFLLVFIGSIYKILEILTNFQNLADIPVFLLLIIISFYFISKTNRSRHR